VNIIIDLWEIIHFSILLKCTSLTFHFLWHLKSQQKFFAELQERQREFHVSDIQLGLATLEEVFLNIAKQAELESAAAEGKMVTLALTSGKSVQVGTIYLILLFFICVTGTKKSSLIFLLK